MSYLEERPIDSEMESEEEEKNSKVQRTSSDIDAVMSNDVNQELGEDHDGDSSQLYCDDENQQTKNLDSQLTKKSLKSKIIKKPLSS